MSSASKPWAVPSAPKAVNPHLRSAHFRCPEKGRLGGPLPLRVASQSSTQTSVQNVT